MTASRPNLLSTLLPVIAIVAVIAGSLALIKNRAPQRPAEATTGGAELALGKVLPDFTVTPLSGDALLVSKVIADAHGKVMMINFWATWCEACVEEMPSLVKLEKAYRQKGFKMVSINVDENPNAVVPRAAKSLKMDFPVFVDPEGKVADIFDVHAIPLTVIMDASRKILLIESGDRNWDSKEMHKQMEKWLSSLSS